MPYGLNGWLDLPVTERGDQTHCGTGTFALFLLRVYRLLDTYIWAVGCGAYTPPRMSFSLLTSAPLAAYSGRLFGARTRSWALCAPYVPAPWTNSSRTAASVWSLRGISEAPE